MSVLTSFAAGYKSVTEAKDSTERSYNGISEKWNLTNYSLEEEKLRYEAELKSSSCSFCGRTILQITAMVGDEVRICNHCIDEFHEVMHQNDEETYQAIKTDARTSRGLLQR
ncbi:MAG: ClpX C4-type zinc finger protein [Candidatus Thiodiazotropha sp. LLP2]